MTMVPEPHEFEELENATRPEDSREVRAILEEDFAKQLKSLKEDLSATRATNKMHALDHRYEDNQRRGLDKFKTLRQIRQGNTKRRVEEFEAL
ncbi:unnamed protein product [Protopolystoma xenopodis]|uniref:Ezrin/radixin/moesin C-terminal domain-containing protein n=1 Tax=Protopolystoma xenopodis TaxID=117903 RepID=A0A3S5FF76_9PLAT|nr:unnamed protein product [Protopolystoma xenopodis]